jgi:hypothetical protein
MNGASIRWSFRDEPDLGGAFKLPSVGRNLKGWTRSDFFTDDPDKPREIRVPDEVPLASKFHYRPCWWSAVEEPMLMWEIFGDTCADVGISGFDDYVVKGIELLFCADWTSLISESELAFRTVEKIRGSMGLQEGWSKALLARADKLSARARRKPSQRRTPDLKTFASLFPGGGRFTTKNGKLGWRIRSSGVSGPPEDAETTRAVVAFLEASGVAVTRSGSGGIGGGEMYTLRAPFLDGGLFAQTGVYFYQSKSAWITGARAAMFVALGLGLRVPRRLQTELGVSGGTLDALRAEVLTSQASRRE